MVLTEFSWCRVVFRDVPKDVTIKDIAEQFPDAVSFMLYDKTFPASKYWWVTLSVTDSQILTCTFTSHAALRFKNTERVAEILKSKNLKIAGKKVYVFPACLEFLHEYPKLGEPEPVVEQSGNGTEVKDVKYLIFINFFATVDFHLLIVGSPKQKKESRRRRRGRYQWTRRRGKWRRGWWGRRGRGRWRRKWRRYFWLS